MSYLLEGICLKSEIQTALDLRYLSAKARRIGVYKKGPKSFTQVDRLRFSDAFSKKMSKFEGIRKSIQNYYMELFL